MKNFNPNLQYRCTIIRGKAKKDLDNLLPMYAKIINELCPCDKKEFDNLFNKYLEDIIGDGTKKTLDNHRTEIAGRLFGMYYEDENDIIHQSERTLKFINDEDQPAFFKDICMKFQFPNGMDSSKTIQDKIDHKISIRQFSFILELLYIANNINIYLTKDELAYFVLNSLEVLQGMIAPEQVLNKIVEYREKEEQVKVKTEGKESSYDMQHINEQINLLELANLIRVQNSKIYLNIIEDRAITYIKSFWNKEPEFNVYSYDSDDKKTLRYEWQNYYSNIDRNEANTFKTSLEAIKFNIERKEASLKKSSKIELGDEGEEFVYQYEKARVSEYDIRLVNKIHLLGKTRGLGYDIQSIIADGSDKSEFVQYIEVKSTIRATLPDNNDGWFDAITLTRNEWTAAEQHGVYFSFYRVYFTPDDTIIYIIKNPFDKTKGDSLKCTPMNYRLDFKNTAVDLKIESKN